jgi:hypothetical protein
MASSDSRHSSDESSGSDDPDQSSAVPNSLSLLDDAYAIDRDSLVDGTPQKQFDELDRQSDGSAFYSFHTPTQRRHLPLVSPVKVVKILFLAIEHDSIAIWPKFDGQESDRLNVIDEPLF